MLSALLGLGFSHLSVRPPYSAESRTKFAEDSSQEGDGFEIQVPRQIDNALRRTRTAPLSASTLPPGGRSIFLWKSSITKSNFHRENDVVRQTWSSGEPIIITNYIRMCR